MGPRRMLGLIGFGLVGWVAGCDGRRSALPTLESPALARLIGRLPDPGAGDEAVEAYWKGLKGKVPLVEPVPGEAGVDLVSFVYRGGETTRSVAIVGCPTDRTLEPMTRLGTTDLWCRSVRVPAEARFLYRFQINGPAEFPEDHDELQALSKQNPPRSDPLGTPSGLLRVPVVVGSRAPAQPWLEPKPGVPAGVVRRTALHSARLHEIRPATLYTPAGWRADPARPVAAPVLVVLDGEMYGGSVHHTVSVATILDNLIAARQIPPTVAVLVGYIDQPRRTRDMYGSDDFAAFLATELVPWVAEHAGVAVRGDRTAILGSSAGGVGAVYAALRYPACFGNAVALSGAFPFGPGDKVVRVEGPSGESWLSLRSATADRLPARVFLAVARFERRAARADLTAANRRLRDVLAGRKVDVIYHEIAGGHDPSWWWGSIADALIALPGPPRQ